MKIKKHFWDLAVFCLVIIFGFGVTAYADDSALLSKMKDLEQQMAQMKKVIDSQNQKISLLEKNAPQIQMAAPPVESKAAASMSEYDFNQMLDSATGGAQKWLKDLKFSGDFRLRYESFANHGVSPDADRTRFRFRLRYGFEKKFGEQMTVGFSLASGERTTNTGHNGDSTSTNQTFGNLADFKNIWIEKAFATYKPNWAKFGPLDGVELTGGKFTNPFEKGSSDMIFDRDLKPEGAYETARFSLLNTSDVKLGGYLTAGQYIMQESGTLGRDSEMYGFQLGINPTVYTPVMDRPIDFLGAISYYDYRKYERFMNWRIDQAAAGQSLSNGNSVCSANELCTGYKVFEYYNEMTVTPYKGIPITPFVDVAHNMDGGRSTLDKNAWSLGAKIGKQVQKGDWQASYAYKWIGADAYPGAFSDSDFGYRGYNGNQGSVVKLGYMLTDNLIINLAGYFVRNLNIGSPNDYTAMTTLLKSEQQSRFQVDLVWKF